MGLTPPRLLRHFFLPRLQCGRKSRTQPGLTERCTRHGSLQAVLILILLLRKEMRSNSPKSCGFALLCSLAGGEGSGMAGAAPESLGVSREAASDAEPTPRSSLQGFYNPWKINLLSPLCSSEMGKKLCLLERLREQPVCWEPAPGSGSARHARQRWATGAGGARAQARCGFKGCQRQFRLERLGGKYRAFS